MGVSGDYPERFLNLCVQSGFRVFNTRRRSENMELFIFARDYKRIRKFRKKCGVRLKIKRRYGLPFIMRRYKRLGLAVGAAAFAAVLFIMPKFVWSINISGNKTVDSAQIYEALETVGITIGTPLDDVDADNMRLRLALLLPELSWASINIDGTAVNVEVREASKRIEADERYSNLVAQFDGVITAVYVRTGTAAVKVGDAVTKGEMLVSGTEEYKDGSTRFRHSDADIIANFDRTAVVKIPVNQVVERDIADGQRRLVLSFFGCDIPLYVGNIGYPHRAEYEQTPLIIDGIRLPISVFSATFYKTEAENIMLTESQALSRAESLLKDKEGELFCDYEILSSSTDIKKSGDNYVITAKYTLSGNIARQEYFEVENNL